MYPITVVTFKYLCHPKTYLGINEIYFVYIVDMLYKGIFFTTK